VAHRKTARKTSTKRRTSSPSTKKAASRKTKPGSKASRATNRAGDQEVTIDRRRSRLGKGEAGAEGQKSPIAAPMLERRKKVNRRRQIDPTTCERDYTGDEIEFMNALDDYKRKSGRMFPTCSEVLEVVRSIGYVKLSTADADAGQFGSSSMALGSATTSWSAAEANGSEEQDEEALFEAALAD
jgi:hypothetical protein